MTQLRNYAIGEILIIRVETPEPLMNAVFSHLGNKAYLSTIFAFISHILQKLDMSFSPEGGLDQPKEVWIGAISLLYVKSSFDGGAVRSGSAWASIFLVEIIVI